jgi:uncharacterized protein YgbK (DUF1537 family)
MSKSFVVAACFTLLSCLPAMAQSMCTAPIAPAAVDGTTSTQEQVRAAVQDAKAFIAQSDVYQTCLGKEIEDAKAKAEADKVKFDTSVARVAMAKADSNQKMKEKVGAEANSAVASYKKAHPAP